MSTLDPHAPLVLDTRELGRRPGSMRRVRRTVPAPSDLRLGDVVGVPEGADVDLDLRLESVVEGVLVTGSARAPLVGECVRCLDPIDGALTADVLELYVHPDRAPDDRQSDTDSEELTIEDDRLDLEPVLRDALVLALPQAPLCRDDCPGLCPQCGVRLADDPHHAHESTDPRWAALVGLLAADRHDDQTVTGSDGAGSTEEN